MSKRKKDTELIAVFRRVVKTEVVRSALVANLRRAEHRPQIVIAADYL